MICGDGIVKMIVKEGVGMVPTVFYLEETK